VEGATTAEVTANAAVPPAVKVAETGSVNSSISIGFLVLRIFLYIFPIFFAVLVANHLIFMPSPVRLFAFLFVYIYMGIYPVFTIGIPVYYLLFMAFNFYHNMQLSPKLSPTQKLALSKPLIPAIRGFLPLSTWKTDSLWTFETLLFPFKYKAIRGPELYTNNPIPPTPAEVTYKNDRLEYEQYCAQLIPGFDKLITTGVGEALKQAYDIHMAKLNYSPVKVTPKPAPPVPKPSTPPVPLISKKQTTTLTNPEGPDTAGATTANPIRKGTPSLPEGPVQPTSKSSGNANKPIGNASPSTSNSSKSSGNTSKSTSNTNKPTGNASQSTSNASKSSGNLQMNDNNPASPYYAKPLGPPPPLEQPK